VRLIGNKTRLLGEIEGLLDERGIRRGTFIDIFSGTASVGRHFKARGFRVIANDALPMCYTKAVHEIEVGACPSFSSLLSKHGFATGDAATSPVEHAVRLLAAAPPEEGLVFRSFSPGGGGGRMYFTDQNARRMDGMLRFLRENGRDGSLERRELHLLLSTLLDAADRVANISGTYGAYLKSWQPNAVAPIALRIPEIIPSRLENLAFNEDANSLVRRIRGDVLYADPPYNHRQYAANYHVLLILAEHHGIDDLEAFEKTLYGKTGLRPYEELRSSYSVPGEALAAMTDLVLSANVDHVVVSYNEEGLISREELGAILARFSGAASFDFDRDMRSIPYRRFRSDADRARGGSRGARRYKVLPGRGRNEIREWLLIASRTRAREAAEAR